MNVYVEGVDPLISASIISTCSIVNLFSGHVKGK